MKRNSFLWLCFILTFVVFGCKKDSFNVENTNWIIDFSITGVGSGDYSLSFHTAGSLSADDGIKPVSNVPNAYEQKGDSVIWTFKAVSFPNWATYRGKLNGETKIAGKIVINDADDSGSFTGTRN